MNQSLTEFSVSMWKNDAAFRLLVEQLADVVTVYSDDGTILYENPSVQRVLGYEPAARMGQSGFTTVHPEDRPLLLAMFAEAVRKPNRVRRAALRMQKADGTWLCMECICRDLSEQPSLDGYLVVARDLTERDTPDPSLNPVDPFRKVVDDSPVPIIIHRGGFVVHANPALLSALGHKEARAILDRRLLELTSAENEASLDDRGPVVLVSASGREVPFDGSTVPVFFDGAAALLTSYRAINKAENPSLALADRLSSVGTLAGGVAHEINNPLAYVLANIKFCLEELEDLPSAAPVEEMRQALQEALEGGDRVTRIVRDLKMFSQGAEASGDVDVCDVIESAINMTRNEIRHRAILKVDMPNDPRTVEGNSAKLGQLFLNLLLNAAQAIPEGAAAQNEIRISLQADADTVIVGIYDTGVGIAPDLHQRIFEPFFTAHQGATGPGLGLSICHGIVAGMGGRIEVESEVAKGSLFRVFLPRRQATPVSADESRAHILVIDDEELVGRAVQRTLQEHDVTVLTSAREALNLLLTSVHFDLIICDLLMPDVTGMEVYAELLRTAPHHLDRIVFLTGGAFTPRAKAFLAGVPNRQLDKPFEIANLRAAVEELLAELKG